jgi:hypothetical protein
VGAAGAELSDEAVGAMGVGSTGARSSRTGASTLIKRQPNANAAAAIARRCRAQKESG